MIDPIVDDVRRVRDAHAARFNYDLDAIFQDIKNREQQNGLVFVDGVARQREPDLAQPTTEVVPAANRDARSRELAPAAKYSH